jgi:hypothetical protein
MATAIEQNPAAPERPGELNLDQEGNVPGANVGSVQILFAALIMGWPLGGRGSEHARFRW